MKRLQLATISISTLVNRQPIKVSILKPHNTTLKLTLQKGISTSLPLLVEN
jgi:hypothetical protein